MLRWAPKWIYLPIFEHYNISRDNNLWNSVSPLLQEINIRVHRLFCMEFNRSTTFICSIFGYTAYFCQCWDLEGISLAIFVFLCLHFLLVLKMAAVGLTSTWALITTFSINISGGHHPHISSQLASGVEGKSSLHHWHPCRTGLPELYRSVEVFSLCFDWTNQLLPLYMPMELAAWELHW